MCTNRALVNSLECYMDDLVDLFEDFVKKSLILISVGVGTVVVMLVYMLKVLTDRTGTPDAAADSRGQSIQHCRSSTCISNAPSKCSSKRSNVRSDFMLCCEPKLTCASINTLPMRAAPSCDERVLRDIGLSTCNKVCDARTRPRQGSPRISISSLPTCLPKQHLSPPRNCVKLLKRTSCCSMCCDDDKSSIH